MEKENQKFVMTFGCGQPLQGYAMQLIARDENQARAYMYKEFNGRWCGTYTIDRWMEMLHDTRRNYPLEKLLDPVDVTGFDGK